MKRALCSEIPAQIGHSVELPEVEHHHLISVLRMKPGYTIELIDGSGRMAEAELVFKGKKLYAQLTTTPKTVAELNSKPIHLFLAMIKPDPMEWAIEKAVELGVRSLTPLQTEFTVVRTKSKGTKTFQERYQKIADQALKQCGRLDRLTVHPPTTLETLAVKHPPLLWLDEKGPLESDSTPHLIEVAKEFKNDAGILVGPEGGFSPSERALLIESQNLTQTPNQRITRVHLGSVILRAETAALYAAAILNALHR